MENCQFFFVGNVCWIGNLVRNIQGLQFSLEFGSSYWKEWNGKPGASRIARSILALYNSIDAI
jgi:hypothetical protein